MNSFVSRLIDRAPTQEMKDRIAELAMFDFEAKYGNADPKRVMNSLIDKILNQNDRKLLEKIKKCLGTAVENQDQEKIEWCQRAITELTQPPKVNLHPKDIAKKNKFRTLT